MRISQKDLEDLVTVLNNRTGNKYDYDLGYAYGGVRLESHGGSVDVLYRTTKREQYEIADNMAREGVA